VVFVVPANRHVNITDSAIDLSAEPSSGPPIPSINKLMETAAGVYGEKVVWRRTLPPKVAREYGSASRFRTG
jgi:chemotaxis response regulator CheB